MEEIKIPTAFRWNFNVLKIKHSETAQMFMRSINWNMKDKSLTCEIIDCDEVINWIREVIENPFFDANICNFDGNGDVISIISFKKIILVNHECKFDYSNSNILTHKINFKYNSFELIRNDEQIQLY